MMWNSSWTEIVAVLNGEYNNDVIGSLNIIEKFGVQNDYEKFFQEKFTTLVVLSVAIFIAMLIICTIIKRAVNKNKAK